MKYKLIAIDVDGTLLDADHTLLHFRDELYEPRVLWRRKRADWEGGGRPRPGERAEEVASDLMDAEPRGGMTAEQEGEMERLADEFVAGQP